MNPKHLRLLASAVFFLLAPAAFAQSPTPTATPCPSANPFPPCPLGVGWAEGLVQYTQYPAPPFPVTETNSICAVDCNFHQWSWEAFVWATAIGPDGRARFTSLLNHDELGKKAAPSKGPKPLGLKPRDVKPRSVPQNRVGDAPDQAGGGIVVDQNGQIVWYSTHMNQAYFDFVQKYGGAGYSQASATLTFPVGAAVFKASWRVVQTGEDTSKFYTEKTTVPLLANNPCGGIMIDPSGKTRPVTVALVGLHVVGVTPNHPEFLWGTFEQVRNAPDLPAGIQPTDPVSNQNFTFYAAKTPMNACNVYTAASALKVTDPVKQTVAPITNIYRLSATGGATPAGRVTDIGNVNTASQQEMASMGKLKPPQPKETVWANYQLIGTLWLPPNTLVPDDQNMVADGVGSVNLANATLETFFQGAGQSCFMCHTTQGSTGAKTYPPKNINLSHALLETLPGPTPKPTPTCSPAATPAAKKSP
jgi:hypothetical protein